VREVYVDEKIKEYIVDLVRATREHPDVYLGASPRGSLGLYHTAQASAAASGRDYVIPDDVKALVPPTLGHRLIISPAARIKNVEASAVIKEIMASVRVPGAVPVH
jgi:MoxR-like ATPase